jgi:hypothetical protein
LRHREKKEADGVPVRLTRKYSEVIDGVDLSGSNVGDQLQLTPRDASLLIAEGWATPCEPSRRTAGPREKGQRGRNSNQG